MENLLIICFVFLIIYLIRDSFDDNDRDDNIYQKL
jgi:hypothetical protein